MPVIIILALLATLTHAQGRPWPEIVGPTHAKLPAASPFKVTWRSDLKSALVEAQKGKKPLFVTWRCLPCKQCADFDKRVLDGSPALTPLLDRFVTVRMTDASQLDARIFPYTEYQDLDLSWWGYFLSPEGRLYGIFGGKDHVSDSTRISEEALVNSLTRILEHHYDPRRQSWDVDGPTPNFREAASTPKSQAGFAEFASDRPWLGKQACLHCHQVRDIQNGIALANNSFNLKAFSQPWPLPENVGITLDRDHGLRVHRVAAGSPAERLGIRAGDELAMANEKKLFGQADFRGVLHRAPLGTAKVTVGWLRKGLYARGILALADDWRKTEISWRKSVYDGVVGEWIGFFPNRGPSQGRGRLSVRPYMGRGNKAKENPWWPEGLRPNMEVVAINGRRDDWNSRELLTWFKLNHKKGDRVTIEVKGGKTFSRRLPLR
ncbi:MAG: serine protease Do [Rhodothermales bacterium]|jgi:serine protease Do